MATVQTGVSDRTAESTAKSGAVFRDANERISALAGAEAMTHSVPFICECAEESCREIVQMSLAEYQAIRADPRHFFNVPGHDAAAGPHGEVVGSHDRYVVVRVT